MRDELLRLVVEAIRAANGRPPEELTVTVDADGATMVFRARPGELGRRKNPALAPAPTPPEEGLSDAESALLAAATAEPQTGRALARKAGYAWSSHARTALTSLVRRGKLIRTTGYRLPA